MEPYLERPPHSVLFSTSSASHCKIRSIFQHCPSPQRHNRSTLPASYCVMEPDSMARTSYLERLPTELICAILSQLSDLTALRCAILSCRWILDSFTGNSSAIATRVFLNELDSCDVRPEAIAALLTSRLAKPTRSSAREFHKVAYLQKRNVEVGICLTLHEVADLSRLHSAVSRLAQDFAEASLQEFAATMKDGHTSQPQSQPLALSTLERHRIMRTLYILEIFFNIFRQTSTFVNSGELDQWMNDFLLTFAPWEIEQIGCVQDFLFFYVSPCFNEMAAHDVYWGEFNVEPARWFGNHHLQSLYFNGLISLESIAKAKTYDQQYALLGHGQIPQDRSRNLYQALIRFNPEVRDEQASVSNYETSRDYALTVKRPYFEDPDDGPFSVWRWAHESASVRRSVYQREQAKLRKWGYVMWDRARLNTFLAFRYPWRPPVSNALDRSLPYDPVEDLDDDRSVYSWRERSRIYHEQGRGWWGFYDESKIVWARGTDGPEQTLLRRYDVVNPWSGLEVYMRYATNSQCTDIARRG
ncbi:hypothetical protein F5Y14DRAFT_423425 [Nemania sp. NC0429]|nr:hypothetical protein F5Y14DRAFT_423425 [Nemania sp. NC0429]